MFYDHRTLPPLNYTYAHTPGGGSKMMEMISTGNPREDIHNVAPAGIPPLEML